MQAVSRCVLRVKSFSKRKGKGDENKGMRMVAKLGKKTYSIRT